MNTTQSMATTTHREIKISKPISATFIIGLCLTAFILLCIIPEWILMGAMLSLWVYLGWPLSGLSAGWYRRGQL